MVEQKQLDIALNQTLWRWHVIAGLITLPLMLFLTATGTIYLFKSQYEAYQYESVFQIPEGETKRTANSFQSQINAIEKHSDNEVESFDLPTSDDTNIAYKLRGHKHGGHYVYVNPYNLEISGEINQRDSLMHKVRKLHGELLLDTPGTLVVELVASWFLVLVITGIYVYWPKEVFALPKLFSKVADDLSTGLKKTNPRLKWRNLHRSLGLILSIFMLIIIAGAMPWTDLFGGQLKRLQKQTDTGYPAHWRNADKIHSEIKPDVKPINIDDFTALLKQENLVGTVNIKLPQGLDGVYTVSNHSFWLEDQVVKHFDRYSGEKLIDLNWQQVGILMELRQVFMRLHEGEYGLANWYILLLVSLLFLLSTSAGLVSYLKRKPSGDWGMINAPKHFKAGAGVIAIIVLMAIVFPAFGISLVFIFMYRFLHRKFKPAR